MSNYPYDTSTPLENQLSEIGVHAGFPNPAAEADHHAPTLSLDRSLIPRPNSTYIFRLTGHTWLGQGIDDGDLAIVDRSLSARPTDLIVAWQGDGFLLARRRDISKRIDVWGIVTSIVHTYRGTS